MGVDFHSVEDRGLLDIEAYSQCAQGYSLVP
jgi:hypothetical protein